MSVIISWNLYINYLKETASKGFKPIGFDEWSHINDNNNTDKL